MRLNSAAVKQHARELGFTLSGIAPLVSTPELRFYSEWLDRGFAGEMHYLERQRPARLDPQSLLPGARSIIVCATNYNTDRPTTRIDAARAWVSRYAWGDDYHDTLQRRLETLAHWIVEHGEGKTRAYVDTGPLTERVHARYAGIGWFGKNTCIINQAAGSWLFLGCILTDLELEFDTAAPDRCGSCTRCIDACPTDAIIAPYVLDSRKCISYTTIELRGEIPPSARDGLGHHLFGCDICQDVCPWNRKAPVTGDAAFQPRDGLFWPEIETLLDMDETAWQELLRGSALRRTKVKGMLRNLMVVAANSGRSTLVPRLRRFLTHADEVVRSHAQWAVEKLTGE